MSIIRRARILLPALLCGVGLCDGNQGLEPIWKRPKPDWVGVIAQPEGVRTLLKIDREPPAGISKYATVKGKLVSADATSIKQSLDLNSRGHALVNLGIAAPIAAGGFLLFNRTRVIYKRDSSK